MDPKEVTDIHHELYQIYLRISEDNIPTLHNFIVFWRSFILKLITSHTLSVKTIGWDQISVLLEESKAGLLPQELEHPS